MKASIVILLCVSLRVFATDADLARLQKSYEEASKRALAPVQATYQKELQRLIEQHTKTGKLEAALEVKEELKRLTDEQLAEKEASNPNEAALRQKLTKGKFVFFFAPPRSKLLTFARSGKLDEGGAVQEYRWRVEGNEVLIYNEDGQLTHAILYDPVNDKFSPSTRPTLYMSRKSYIEYAK